MISSTRVEALAKRRFNFYEGIMNIFDKRPLFLIITVFISGFVAFTLSDKLIKGVLIAISVLLFGLSLFLYFYKKKKVIILLLSSIVALLSILFSFIYFDIYFRVYEKYDEAVQIEGTIVSVDNYDFSSSYIIKTKTINGKHSPYKIKLYSSDYTLKDAVAGTKISFYAKLGAFEDFSDFDAETYYFADGISAEATEIKDLEITGMGAPPLASFFADMRAKLVERATKQSDEKSSSLFSALLLGERHLLSGQVQLDFKRLGITHILALSGQHLTILSLAIQKLLSIFKVNKKPRLIITSVFIILYVALTGFSASVLRAAIMVLIYSALFLLSQTSDSPTSLAISVALIIIAEPYSVYDAALWLSALATFGIVTTTTLWEKKRDMSALQKAFHYIGASLFVTFVATSGTLAITAYIFGATSLLAAPATLIFSIICELILYVGSFMLMFGNVIPIGKILALLCDLIYYLAESMSEPDIVYIQIDYPLIKILILIYTIAFVAFLTLKIKRKKLAMTLLASLFSIVMLFATAANIISSHNDMILYASDDKGDVIVLRDNTETTFVSASTYSKSKAYDDASLLEEYRIQSVDQYVITHYSKSLSKNISKFIALIKVDKICLPIPVTSDEMRIAESINEILCDTKTVLEFYKPEETVDCGRYSFELFYTADYSEKHKCGFVIESEDEKILYLSSGMLEPETKYVALKNITDTTAIILGCHGKNYSNTTYLSIYKPEISDIILGSNDVDIDKEILVEYLDNGTEIHYEKEVLISD